MILRFEFQKVVNETKPEYHARDFVPEPFHSNALSLFKNELNLNLTPTPI
jgi:hypothetical protein